MQKLKLKGRGWSEGFVSQEQKQRSRGKMTNNWTLCRVDCRSVLHTDKQWRSCRKGRPLTYHSKANWTLPVVRVRTTQECVKKIIKSPWAQCEAFSKANSSLEDKDLLKQSIRANPQMLSRINTKMRVQQKLDFIYMVKCCVTWKRSAKTHY